MTAFETERRPVREQFLPFALPQIGDEEIAEVVDSLRSGWITTGPKVKRFEADFAARVGARHTIAVSSCTAGLHLALCALDIGPGDEVILPTLTFCATANVVVHVGARPVLVDVGPDGNCDPAAVAAAITPRTRAIMPVHFAGQACDLDQIYDLAARNGLAVIEDAAHAVGSTYRGRPIGADDLADTGVPRVTVFSFYATKNMTTGEGGMIATADEALAERMRLLHLHGMSRDAWKRYTSAGSWFYEVVAAGFKNNMTDIQAALGIHQLRRLDTFIAVRQEYAARYDEAFAALAGVRTLARHTDRNHVFHLYVAQFDPEQVGMERGALIEALRARNIGTSVHFIPVHLHPFYAQEYGYRRGDMPVAEAMYDRSISLPLYPLMSPADVEDVIAAVSALAGS